MLKIKIKKLYTYFTNLFVLVYIHETNKHQLRSGIIEDRISVIKIVEFNFQLDPQSGNSKFSYLAVAGNFVLFFDILKLRSCYNCIGYFFFSISSVFSLILHNDSILFLNSINSTVENLYTIVYISIGHLQKSWWCTQNYSCYSDCSSLYLLLQCLSSLILKSCFLFSQFYAFFLSVLSWCSGCS